MHLQHLSSVFNLLTFLVQRSVRASVRCTNNLTIDNETIGLLVKRSNERG